MRVTPCFIKPIANEKHHSLHPSVVYDESGIGGHNYWMVETPFAPFHLPPYRDRWELPYVHYSNDGLSWHSNMMSPLADLNASEVNKKEYYSDPHLVRFGKGLKCFYRFSSSSGNTKLFSRESKDGIHWSKAVSIYDTHSLEEKIEIISPSYCVDGNIIRCWYVDADYTSANRSVRCSIIGNNQFLDIRQCQLNGPFVRPWHIDIQCWFGEYYLTVFDVDSQCICIYKSQDGVNFNFISSPINQDCLQAFYRNGVYRASLVRTNIEYRLYFSAQTKFRSSIGVAISDDLIHWSVVSGCSGIEIILNALWDIEGFFSFYIGKIHKKIIKL